VFIYLLFRFHRVRVRLPKLPTTGADGIIMDLPFVIIIIIVVVVAGTYYTIIIIIIVVVGIVGV